MATKTLPATGGANPTTAAGRNDARDQRDARVQQLVALTATLAGEGFASFSNYADDVQCNVLWLVHELAADVERFNDTAEGYGPKEEAHV